MSKPSQTNFSFTKEIIQKIASYPHVLGWLMGFKDLSEIHSYWIKYIWTAKSHRALNAHRGSYKSTAIVIVGVIWYLLFHPNARIFLVRKTYEDACMAVETIARIMEQPAIRALFTYVHKKPPEFVKRAEGRLLFSFKKTATPDVSVTAFGLKSPFTGHHCDFLICDDISTPKDRVSKAEREFTKFMWRELATNIVDPGTPCCYIGTPWHKDGVESIIPTPLKFSVKDIGILSPEEIEEKRRTTTPSLFAANYLLEFAADDAAPFKDPQEGPWIYRNLGSVEAHIDAAYGGDNSCALTLMAKNKETGLIYARGWSFHGNVQDWIPEIVNIMRMYKCKVIHVEEQGDKGFTRAQLSAKGVAARGYNESTNKQVKIATYLKKWWYEIRWDPNTETEYMMQIVDWLTETKENDDAPDSAASLLRAMFGKLDGKSSLWAA